MPPPWDNIHVYLHIIQTSSPLKPLTNQSQILWEASIPLIGKDGDDVIDKITCELTGTESINTQT